MCNGSSTVLCPHPFTRLVEEALSWHCCLKVAKTKTQKIAIFIPTKHTKHSKTCVVFETTQQIQGQHVHSIQMFTWSSALWVQPGNIGHLNCASTINLSKCEETIYVEQMSSPYQFQTVPRAVVASFVEQLATNTDALPSVEKWWESSRCVWRDAILNVLAGWVSKGLRPKAKVFYASKSIVKWDSFWRLVVFELGLLQRFGLDPPRCVAASHGTYQ